MVDLEDSAVAPEDRVVAPEDQAAALEDREDQEGQAGSDRGCLSPQP